MNNDFLNQVRQKNRNCFAVAAVCKCLRIGNLHKNGGRGISEEFCHDLSVSINFVDIELT